jgi:hypothetical protein
MAYQRPAGLPEYATLDGQAHYGLDEYDNGVELARSYTTIGRTTFADELRPNESRLTLQSQMFPRDLDENVAGDPERLDRVPYGTAIGGLGVEGVGQPRPLAWEHPFEQLQP